MPGALQSDVAVRLSLRGADSTALAEACRGRLARTVLQGNADGDSLIVLREAASMPSPGKRPAGDGDRARSVRQIGLVVSLEALVGRPDIATVSPPLALLEHAFEAVDRPPILEPLDGPGTLLAPARA